MMTLTFGNNDGSTVTPFTVDFSQYCPPPPPPAQPLSRRERIMQLALISLTVLKISLQNFAQATLETGRYLWPSFKVVVLGYGGNLRNIRISLSLSLSIFRIAKWVLLNVGFIFKTTASKTYLHFYPPQQSSEILRLKHEEIDPSHLKTNELFLDASSVEPNITLLTLFSIFDKINFDNPDDFRYVSESRRTEDGKVFTKDELRTHLAALIRNIDGKIPFIGTPRADDIPSLLAFYGHIENAIRLTLHSLHKKLDDFYESNEKDLKLYSEETMRQYNNLIEDLEGVVIDLAIAGAHCGARYMGDATQIYKHFHQNQSYSTESLESSLIALLAQKRKEIAEEEVPLLLREDNGVLNTHSYANYMASLGKDLGIPEPET